MSAPAVPLSSAFFDAILRELAKHPDGLRRRDIHEPVADAMQLTPEQRAQRITSGAPRYRHRMGWSYNMLKSAGYVDSPTLGVWRITDRGRNLLASHPQQLDDATTRNIVKESRRHSDSAEDVSAEQPSTSVQQTPEERIDAAMREIAATVAGELLERISQETPEFFEELVLELLHALGYGTSKDDLEHVGGTGDGGIDGVISLDKLGFEKVYVQAKRWQGAVGRPDVQKFYGAFAGRRAKKGVFITTSTFTKEALDFGRDLSDSVVLIDGSRLTSLMIQYGVGVTHSTLHLPRVDGDYFGTE